MEHAIERSSALYRSILRDIELEKQLCPDTERVLSVQSPPPGRREGAQKGYLYAIRNGDHAVKFGYAKNVKNRLAQLRNGSCYPLTVASSIYVTKGLADLEASVHAALRRFRMRGEWFRIRPQSLRLIELMRAGDLNEINRFLECQNVATLELESIEPEFARLPKARTG